MSQGGRFWGVLLYKLPYLNMSPVMDFTVNNIFLFYELQKNLVSTLILRSYVHGFCSVCGCYSFNCHQLCNISYSRPSCYLLTLLPLVFQAVLELYWGEMPVVFLSETIYFRNLKDWDNVNVLFKKRVLLMLVFICFKVLLILWTRKAFS